jgi:hypothetical protein
LESYQLLSPSVSACQEETGQQYYDNKYQDNGEEIECRNPPVGANSYTGFGLSPIISRLVYDMQHSIRAHELRVDGFGRVIAVQTPSRQRA